MCDWSTFVGWVECREGPRVGGAGDRGDQECRGIASSTFGACSALAMLSIFMGILSDWSLIRRALTILSFALLPGGWGGDIVQAKWPRRSLGDAQG